MERVVFLLAGLNGLLGVTLGAFGAHGLQARLAGAADAAQRLGWWETAAHYQLVHAIALGLCAHLFARGGSTAASAAGYCFAAGIAVFSGSLYAMTLSGMRGLGAITPIGGLLLLAGWVAFLIAAWGIRAR